MTKLIYLLIILISFYSCSFNENSKFWSKSKKVDQVKSLEFQEIFPKKDILKKELNSKLNLRFTSNTSNYTNINNFLNNDGRLNFSGKLKKNLAINFLR